jgi:hypothetical protein
MPFAAIIPKGKKIPLSALTAITGRHMNEWQLSGIPESEEND